MYGPPGLDVDYCKLFMDSLEPSKEESSAGISDHQMFIPSPQTMLNASADPFQLSQPAPVKEEPEENGFGHYFGLNNDMWSGPSDSSPSDQSVSVDVMDMLGSKRSNNSPPEQSMNPSGVMFYPSPTHIQGVSPPHLQSANYGAPLQMSQAPHSAANGAHQLNSPPMGQNSFGSPLGANHRSPMEPHKLPAPSVSKNSSKSSVTKRPSVVVSNVSKVPTMVPGASSPGRQRKSKSTHNLIEKRYRNNINDKINILRDCVPGLRDQSSATESTSGDGAPQPRLNKATVLTKAAEYIRQLQQRNSALAKELSALRAQNGLDPTQLPPLRSPQNEAESSMYMDEYGRPPSASSMSSVSSSGTHFSSTTKMAATCVVGGALTMGGMLGNDDLRGLAAVPLNLPFAPTHTLGSFLKVASAISLLGAAFSLCQDRQAAARPKATKLSGSLQEHRHSAYQTACHMLNTPTDASALGMIWSLLVALVQLAILSFMGEGMLNAFMELSGIDARQRRSLIMQASDTQLVGGSSSGASTLHLLHLFVSQSLLPATPRRYMIQSMQAQELGRNSIFRPVFDEVASRLWRKASQCTTGTRESSPFPDHLSELAALEYKDVMTPRTRKWLGWVFDSVSDPKCRDYNSLVNDHSLTSAVDILAAANAIQGQNAALQQLLVDDDKTKAINSLKKVDLITPPATWTILRSQLLQVVINGASDGDKVRNVLQETQAMLRRYSVSCHETVTTLQSIMLLHHHSQGSPESQEYARQLAAQLAVKKNMVTSSADVLCIFFMLRELAKDSHMEPASNLSDAAFVCRQWFGRDECAGEFGLGLASRRRLVRESISMARVFAQV